MLSKTLHDLLNDQRPVYYVTGILPGSFDDGVVNTERCINLAEGGPLLHHPYSLPSLCFSLMLPYVRNVSH
jgi:hypothetical protein